MDNQGIETNFNEKVYLSYKDLSNLEESLLRNLKKKVQSSCDKDRGYIEEVIAITSYYNVVSRIYNTVDFNVSFRARYIKPESGLVLYAKIINIPDPGVHLEKGLISIFVPIKRISPEISKTIKIGDIVSVVIEDVRYGVKNKNYICIGSGLKLDVRTLRRVLT